MTFPIGIIMERNRFLAQQHVLSSEVAEFIAKMAEHKAQLPSQSSLNRLIVVNEEVSVSMSFS